MLDEFGSNGNIPRFLKPFHSNVIFKHSFPVSTNFYSPSSITSPPATALQTLNQPPSSSKRQSESCVLFPSKRGSHSYISVPDPLSWSQHDHPMTAWMSACLLSLSKTFFSTENEDNSKVNIITAFIENYLPVFVWPGQSIFAMFIS